MFVWQVPDGLGGTELCKHLSAMNLSHQSSLDSVGEPPGPQTSIQYIMAAQGQVPSVNMPQQSYTVAQVNRFNTHAPKLAYINQCFRCNSWVKLYDYQQKHTSMMSILHKLL